MTVCFLSSGCRWLEKPGYEPDAISNVEEKGSDSVPGEISGSTAGSAGPTGDGSTAGSAGPTGDGSTAGSAGSAEDGSTAGSAGSAGDGSTGSASDPADSSDTSGESDFPAYTYPGTDALYRAICEYIVSDFASESETSESETSESEPSESELAESEPSKSESPYSDQGNPYVCIPCPLIVDIDESNPEDIRISGEFWCHKYTIEEDILQTVSSECVSGMLHLRTIVSDDDLENGVKYEMIKFDEAVDETVEEIFGENYQAYIALNSFISIREIFRTQMLEDYLLLNEIPAVKYQDGEYKSVDLIPKKSSLTSVEQLAIQDTDGSGQRYTFSYDNQTFNAQYTEDNWKIVDSWKIRNTGDMELICGALLDVHSIHSRDGNGIRTAEDMAFEWMQHNFAYEHLPEDHPWRENAKDVDLNPADQGKTFFEIYEDRAQDRFRIGDFLGDMTVYLQMLQEMDPEQLGIDSEQ